MDNATSLPLLWYASNGFRAAAAGCWLLLPVTDDAFRHPVRPRPTGCNAVYLNVALSTPTMRTPLRGSNTSGSVLFRWRQSHRCRCHQNPSSSRGAFAVRRNSKKENVTFRIGILEGFAASCFEYISSLLFSAASSTSCVISNILRLQIVRFFFSNADDA